MIPILYDKTETEFKTLGIGPLSDAISCEVTEERNGSFELRMAYPITGVHYSDIVNEAIICAIPADGEDAQPFRIYKISRPINGKISVYAEHLSYQLSHIVVMPFTAHGAGNTLSGLIDNSIGDQPFSVFDRNSPVCPPVCMQLYSPLIKLIFTAKTVKNRSRYTA